ncbi:class I SAM-dependent methyltransferase [Salinirubellus salinus]|uniref:Class I SAM-dependent methyltransferase n=1 Tax=Salinirubellus salinus TaxID=1364945 RepID=A0A9E7R5Z9_9EURY|nr:class I SAM-dependent methyltransferase [Salinirubellus salinus]UWM56541.1 class I SAM-dependent methyltransferase [Salinirubellus salinus]
MRDDATPEATGDVPLDVATFYDQYGEREWERLDRDFHHRLEWEATVEYLDRHLPATGHVLDAGGGAGRYAVWLAERGHEVTLLDLSERQAALAREKAHERGVGDRVTVGRGDVSALPAPDDAFDATLCLGGPLSHVLETADREQAVRELRRVTADGAPVFVSVMGLMASVTRMLRHAGRVPEADDDTELLADLARTGDYDEALLERYGRDPTVQQMHLFRVDEFESLLEAGGLRVETLAALEGPFSQRRDHLDDLTDEHRAVVRETLDVLREDRYVVDHSAHMLAVCRA